METICSIKNLSFSYNSSKKVLDNISFDIHKNEIVGILGKNGSGKTTLLNLITGFLNNYSGEITLYRQNIKDFSLTSRAKTIAYIQQSKLTIPDYYNVEDFILDGRRPFRKFGFYNKKDYDILDKIINQCSLDSFRKRQVSSLSGGELQRCIFAKALMKQCELLIFDEPTSAMDIKYQKDFFELTSIAKQNLEAGILLSIHDINFAVKYCDRLIVLDSGSIIYDNYSKWITIDILKKAFDTDFSETCSEEKYFYY
ncbi:iron complex transport system ATP-binding protein [Treponema bryantii]|uniref:Iron complex transport system ATP-binding protein n=1 Tax=Treponema bryantii TaxID=163 RepID=A0A1H9IQT0_9SPIR|nr:ABC transporter ATP-binding protein [Treponema bryantii]SEQ76852.1 iron complex transport system ATP-binding protein [Treponema bryantii]